MSFGLDPSPIVETNSGFLQINRREYSQQNKKKLDLFCCKNSKAENKRIFCRTLMIRYIYFQKFYKRILNEQKLNQQYNDISNYANHDGVNNFIRCM